MAVKHPVRRAVVRRLRLLPVAASCAFLAAWFSTPLGAAELQRFDFTRTEMGSPCRLVFYAADERAANIAAGEVFRRFEELNQTLSDYLPDSELNRLTTAAAGPRGARVSDDLWHVLVAAEKMSRASDGAFDVTVGPLVRLWRRARRQRELPSNSLLADARSKVGWEQVELVPATQSVRLLRPGMRLDLGGIASGYAVDQGLQILAKRGLRHAMIDFSGDVGALDPPPGEKGWKVGIAPLTASGPPSRYLLLANRAVTTSGDMFQYVEIDGVRYSHIIDKKTGLGRTDHTLVVTVAPTCMEADALATAVSAMGPSRGLELVNSLPHAAALVVQNGPMGVKQFPSTTFESLPWLKTPAAAPRAVQPNKRNR